MGDAVSIEPSMEDSDSSDFCEEETKKEVDIDYYKETWRCSSTVEWSFLDLEPISEAEQSSFCVELMKRLMLPVHLFSPFSE